MRATSRTTFRELVIGLGALVAAMFAVAAIVWINIGRLEAYDAANREAQAELTQDAAVLETVADQEIGLRGFVATRDPQFLRAYEGGRREFDIAMPALRALAVDDPAPLRQAIDDIAREHRVWTQTVAEPQIANAKAGRAVMADALNGKSQVNAIRADLAFLRRNELQLLAEREVAQASGLRMSRLTLVLGSGSALLFALMIAGRSFGRLIVERKVAQDAAAKLEDALERAHAAERAKATFLSNMSHEMRTPLNGVSGMAQALAMTDLVPAQRELVAVIGSSAATLDGLIGDLLALSRDGEAGRRASDVDALHLGDAARRMGMSHRVSAEAKGLELRVEVAPEAETSVVCDTARLQRLAGALISNALKFTDRGHITLRVLKAGPERYRFEVADTGIGFDEARKAELFEAFTQSDDSLTRRHGGAGLGLALAHHLATDLGGQLDCHSVPGEGSTFTFEIDLAAAAAQSVPEDRRVAA